MGSIYTAFKRLTVKKKGLTLWILAQQGTEYFQANEKPGQLLTSKFRLIDHFLFKYQFFSVQTRSLFIATIRPTWCQPLVIQREHSKKALFIFTIMVKRAILRAEQLNC